MDLRQVLTVWLPALCIAVWLGFPEKHKAIHAWFFDALRARYRPHGRHHGHGEGAAAAAGEEQQAGARGLASAGEAALYSWRAAAGSQEGVASPIEAERAVTQVVQVHADMKSLQSVQEGVDLGLQMPMTSADGASFVCYPSQEFRLVSKNARSNETGSTDDDEDEAALQEIESRFEALRGLCIHKRAKYWTFVVCPFDRIEQNHYENKQSTISFSLGGFQSMERRKNEQGETEWVQRFGDGSDGRHTKLTLKCRRDVGANLVIDYVGEPATHEYEIVAYSTLACPSSVEWQAQQLLAPLHGECIQRVEGWWTYELCIGRHLRQFHQNKDGRSTEYVLGEFDHRLNAELQDDAQVLVTDRHSSRPFYMQKYTEGTACDLRADKRAAEVHFLCSAQSSGPLSASPSAAAAATSIVSITETPTCYYVVKVQTPLVCSHPFFSDQESRSRGILAQLHCLPQSALQQSETG